jgi:acyl phosphate:glycerol-3-phosphate acyltransferase
MQSISPLALFLVVAESYLLGSVPFGYLLVRLFRGEDVRNSGSGNIGATNVSRKSPMLGVFTLLLDALKGAAAVWLAEVFAPSYTMMALAALFAIIGHMFPVWLGLRGGKGVATALGSFAMIAPKAVLIAAGIFIVVVLIFRYISLGSIVAVISFPLFVYEMHAYGNAPTALGVMILSSLLIVAKHSQNIGRLISGTENRLGANRA